MVRKRFSSYALNICFVDYALSFSDWKYRPDATLGEIADLVKEAYTPARQPDYALSMAIIHPDRSGHVIMRNVGFVDPTRPNQDVEKKVLGETGFQPGDLLDVSVEKQHM